MNMSAAMQIFSSPLALISIFFLWKSYLYGNKVNKK